MRRYLLVTVLLLACLGGPLSADIVYLKNGRQVRGVAQDLGSQVRVELEWGSITVSSDQVLKIERETSPLARYRQRRDQLEAADKEGFYELALWASEAGLDRCAREAFEQVLQIDPDHEGARSALGYRRYDGEWMTEDELKRAQGYVQYEGKWLTQEEVVLLQQLEAQKALQRKHEAERRKAEVELAELKQRLAAMEEELERLRRENEYLRSRRTYYSYPVYGGARYGYPYVPGTVAGNTGIQTYTNTATGNSVYLIPTANGGEVWTEHVTGGINVLHTEGDGHTVVRTVFNGIEELRHYPAGNNLGAPDFILQRPR